jgi:hypothetical protein
MVGVRGTGTAYPEQTQHPMTAVCTAFGHPGSISVFLRDYPLTAGRGCRIIKLAIT